MARAAAVPATGGGGGSKIMDKRLLLVAAIVLALFLDPSGMVPIPAAVFLSLLLIFAVYHNGCQVSDCLIFLVIGVALAPTFMGSGAHWVTTKGSDGAQTVVEQAHKAKR